MTRTMNGEKSNFQIRAISRNPTCRFFFFCNLIVKDSQREIDFFYTSNSLGNQLTTIRIVIDTA
jgi:hypothetical protein